jgi:uncharacterized protein YeeX (DUF496 family)
MFAKIRQIPKPNKIRQVIKYVKSLTRDRIMLYIIKKVHCSKSRRQLPVYTGNVEDQTPHDR